LAVVYSMESMHVYIQR